MKEKLSQSGYRSRVVHASRALELQKYIENTHQQGLFDPDFYNTWLNGFDFSLSRSGVEAKSLFILAVAAPQYRFTFSYHDLTRQAILPPTYKHYRRTGEIAGELLARLNEPNGYQVWRAPLPLKLLAVRSGLAKYGRNNITYVPGFGSFHQLAAFFSDLPYPEDDWQEPQMLEACHDCTACLHNCPTGAIATDRFLLHAERCLTFHNEQASEIPFPDWIDPSWHNSLVGCMRCQLTCPQDRDFWKFIEEGPAFTAQETGWLLAGLPLEQLPEVTRAKMLQFDLVSQMEVMPRNLRSLFSSGKEMHINPPFYFRPFLRKWGDACQSICFIENSLPCLGCGRYLVRFVSCHCPGLAGCNEDLWGATGFYMVEYASSPVARYHL